MSARFIPQPILVAGSRGIGGAATAKHGIYIEPENSGPSGTVALPVRTTSKGRGVRLEPLRTWARSAAEGDPIALSLLWAEPHDVTVCTPGGQALRESQELFLSQRIGSSRLALTRAELSRLFGRDLIDRERVTHLAVGLVCATEAMRSGIFVATDEALCGKAMGMITDPGSTAAELRTALTRLELSLNEVLAASQIPVRPRSREINALLVEAITAEHSTGSWMQRKARSLLGSTAHH